MADSATGGDDGATTLDAFYGGRLMLRQPARGHRSGTDAVLLAAAVPRDFAGLAVDVGAGVGAAGLGVASCCPGARVVLVENDPGSAALAAHNIAANRLDSRARLAAVDVLSADARRDAARDADLVITNPPFYDPSAFRLSPYAGRRTAHAMATGGLPAWIAACLDLLAPKGHLVVVHRAEAAFALLGALGGRGLTLLPMYPRVGAAATRVLVRATKGSRAPLEIAAPLVLHDADGFTPDAALLHRGEAALRWEDAVRSSRRATVR